MQRETDVQAEIAKQVAEIKADGTAPEKPESPAPEELPASQFPPLEEKRIDRLSDEIRILRAVSTVLLTFVGILCIVLSAVVIMFKKDVKRGVEDVSGNVESVSQAVNSLFDSRSEMELELAELYGALEGLGSVAYGNSEERILLSDGTYGEIWIPTLAEVEKSPYKPELFEERGGFMYYEDESVASKRGIDVSSFQGEIDWERVAADEIDFAIIRLGYRGYSKGNIMIDEMFERNIEGATAAGIDVGVYFFSQAITVQEAVEEAWTVLSYIQDYEITYPVIFDWEVIYGDSARSDEVSVATLTQSAVAFCEVVKDEGYQPMIYFNKRLGLLKYNLADLTEYGFWYAQYYDYPEFYYKFDIWQYSSTGNVDGIEGDVDLNICFSNFGE